MTDHKINRLLFLTYRDTAQAELLPRDSRQGNHRERQRGVGGVEGKGILERISRIPSSKAMHCLLKSSLVQVKQKYCRFSFVTTKIKFNKNAGVPHESHLQRLPKKVKESTDVPAYSVS